MNRETVVWSFMLVDVAFWRSSRPLIVPMEFVAVGFEAVAVPVDVVRAAVEFVLEASRMLVMIDSWATIVA